MRHNSDAVDKGGHSWRGTNEARKSDVEGLRQTYFGRHDE